MTEPRKTPRTDRYCESGFANYGTGYVNPADFMRALEIETQELAEALAAVLGPYEDDGDALAKITQAEAAIARHRAKQEVHP